ncbi:MAG: hypothetical protein SGPRY_011091 [Prymnesium sp.]
MKDKWSFHLLKPRGSKHALPSRPSKPDLSYALPETVLEPIILELPLPLGVGLDKTNVVAEINEFGSAISSNVRLEDSEVPHGAVTPAKRYARHRDD